MTTLTIRNRKLTAFAPKGEIETLTEEFDALLAEMQTPRARRAALKAFRASPDELAAAAVAVARAKKKRG
jgi:hypothetical protein